MTGQSRRAEKARRTETTADRALPVLRTATALLREVTAADAPALARCFSDAEVRKYLPVGPETADDFRRFIRWVRRERRAGRSLCFAVVPIGRATAGGLVQLWGVEPHYRTAEMGVALERSVWGTNTWREVATAVLDFAYDELGTHRIEYRVAAPNTRGQAAVEKLGAVREGTLRQCFVCPAGLLDHTMWSILAHEWRQRRVRVS